MSNLLKIILNTTLACLCINNSILAQETNLRNINAPTESLPQIKLQTHKGLLRFGFIDISKYNTSNEMKNHYSMLHGLLKVKNEIKEYNPEKTVSEEWNKQLSMNPHPALRLASVLDPSVKKEYFQNYSASSNIPKNYTPSFKGNNEFEKKRSYEKFMSNHLNDLIKWPEMIFPEGTEEAYYVTQDLVYAYDSEKGGISLLLEFVNVDKDVYMKKDIVRMATSQYPSAKDARAKKTYLKRGCLTHLHKQQGFREFEYNVKNEFERNVNADNLIVLFPIAKDKAQKLLPAGQRIFIVRKIRIDDQLMFNVSSPVIELYIDEELKTKVGELNYNSLVNYY